MPKEKPQENNYPRMEQNGVFCKPLWVLLSGSLGLVACFSVPELAWRKVRTYIRARILIAAVLERRPENDCTEISS